MSGRLLDTNHLNTAVRKDSVIAKRIEAERKRGLRVGTCVPVLCELEVGACQVRDPLEYRDALNILLRRLRIWPITPVTAQHYGAIHQDLKRRGRALSQVDIMLAALCRELDLTLVTTDKDFVALPWLRTENWS